MTKSNVSTATQPRQAKGASSRLGVMRCCWLGVDFATQCRLAAELGFSYIEEFAWTLDPEKLPAVEARRILAEHGLALRLVIAAHLDPSQEAASVEGLRSSLDYFQQAGLDRFVSLRAGRKVSLDDFRRVVARCVPLVEARGLVPLVQNHVGGAVQTPEEMLACEDTGAKMHFDTQQFYMIDVPVLAAWDLLGPKVVHVHLGDRSAPDQGCATGEGAVPITALLHRMHASGYRGDITLEVEPGVRDESVAPFVARSKGFVEGVLEPLGALSAAPPGHAVLETLALPRHTADWGELHWIADEALFAGCGQTVGLVTIRPGKANPLHRHPRDQEVIYIRSGRCLHTCGDRQVRLTAGSVLFIPAGQAHRARNDGDVDCEMLVVYPTGRRTFELVE